MQSKRVIGITHRVKQLVRGGEVMEAERPTLVAIDDGSGKVVEYELATETDELDFVLGRFPSAWREVSETEDLELFPSHHIKWKKLGEEAPEGVNGDHVMHFDGLYHIASKVPSQYDGLREGDAVAMMLGGSGDRLAYALSRRAEKIGASVYRVPPFRIKPERERLGMDKKEDHKLLVMFLGSRPELFHLCGPRDRDLIRVTEAFRHRMEAQLARMGCAHRLRQRFIGDAFLSEEGQYPEGRIEDAYEKIAANDTILKALVAEEKKREAELKKIVQSLPVWQELLGPIEGVGEMIAARLISAVGDIRRFESAAKFKAFAGVHVFGTDGRKMSPGTNPLAAGGKFVRRRTGVIADWHPTLRQAFYLMSDQFNRRKHSVWGKKLREYKAKFRAKYPEPVVFHRDLVPVVYGIRNYFETRGVFVSPSGFDFSSADGVYEYHTACIAAAIERGEDFDTQEIEALLNGLPGVVSGNGTASKYTVGHIHKMATWRTITKFAEWLWREWSRLEKQAVPASGDASEELKKAA